MNLLKQIQPIIDQHRSLITVTPSAQLNGDWLFELLDIEGGSGFHFNVRKEEQQEDYYLVSWAPINGDSNKTHKQNYKIEGVVQRLKDWLALLTEYATTPDIFDDPILRSYEAEFTEYFAVQDDDINQAPLDLPRQQYLTLYLEQMEEHLRERAQTAAPQQKTQLLLIEQECASLRETMGESTKAKVARKMSSILAKARKFGLSLLNEFFTELRKEGYKQIAKGIYGADLSVLGTMLDSLGPGGH